MRDFIVLLFVSLFSSNILAGETIYDSLSKLTMLTEGFDVIEMPSGIDLKSLETFKNSKGKVEPLTHLELEGPFKSSNFKTLEQGIDFIVGLIKHEVDSTVAEESNILPGLNAVIVDVNGSKVGLLDYKVNHEPNTYVKRAIMFSEKGVYSFAMSMHKSEPKSKKSLLLMSAVIDSVNSGAL